MKIIVLLLVFLALCNAAPAPEPAPEPAPKPVPAPVPKPNPGLLLSTSPAVVASPVVTYSHYFKSPVYHSVPQYVYNLGYASGYSYDTYPYYVPVHLI